MPRASQPARAFKPNCIEKFLESNLNFKGFLKGNRIIARALTARGTSGEKDPEATLPLCSRGGGGNAIYVPYGDVPPIRVYFLAFESETGCLFRS